MYASKEPSIHSMAGVAIRQIVSALFERVSKSTEEASEGAGQGEEQQMPSHTRDAYLLFQVNTRYIQPYTCMRVTNSVSKCVLIISGKRRDIVIDLYYMVHCISTVQSCVYLCVSRHP